MSDEDEPAPSPSATVVGRRASRAAKSMRVESSCDEDTSSDEADEEWDPEQEQDEEDKGGFGENTPFIFSSVQSHQISPLRGCMALPPPAVCALSGVRVGSERASVARRQAVRLYFLRL